MPVAMPYQPERPDEVTLSLSRMSKPMAITTVVRWGTLVKGLGEEGAEDGPTEEHVGGREAAPAVVAVPVFPLPVSTIEAFSASPHGMGGVWSRRVG